MPYCASLLIKRNKTIVQLYLEVVIDDKFIFGVDKRADQDENFRSLFFHHVQEIF